MTIKEEAKIEIFNPLDKQNLAESVANAMLRKPIVQIPPESFNGAGIYAIYYHGPFPLYAKLTEKYKEGSNPFPIYVGKAVPAGARKGGFGLNANPGNSLHKRLTEHASSIEQAENLDIKDFKCRFLVVEDIWIPLAESLLIEMFSPLWNRKIDGFGNHDPGKGRYQQKKSLWDAIHPGRPWAEKLSPADLDKDSILKMAEDYIAYALKKTSQE